MTRSGKHNRRLPPFLYVWLNWLLALKYSDIKDFTISLGVVFFCVWVVVFVCVCGGVRVVVFFCVCGFVGYFLSKI